MTSLDGKAGVSLVATATSWRWPVALREIRRSGSSLDRVIHAFMDRFRISAQQGGGSTHPGTALRSSQPSRTYSRRFHREGARPCSQAHATPMAFAACAMPRPSIASPVYCQVINRHYHRFEDSHARHPLRKCAPVSRTDTHQSRGNTSVREDHAATVIHSRSAGRDSEHLPHTAVRLRE